MGTKGINVRILFWHFKMYERWKPTIEFNNYHWDNKLSSGLADICEFNIPPRT